MKAVLLRISVKGFPKYLRTLKEAEVEAYLKAKKANELIVRIGEDQDVKTLFGQEDPVENLPSPSIIYNPKEWDFTKLSETHKDLFRTYLEEDNMAATIKLHNDLKLSSNKYCCTYYYDEVRGIIEKAVRDGRV